MIMAGLLQDAFSFARLSLSRLTIILSQCSNSHLYMHNSSEWNLYCGIWGKHIIGNNYVGRYSPREIPTATSTHAARPTAPSLVAPSLVDPWQCLQVYGFIRNFTEIHKLLRMRIAELRILKHPAPPLFTHVV